MESSKDKTPGKRWGKLKNLDGIGSKKTLAAFWSALVPFLALLGVDRPEGSVKPHTGHHHLVGTSAHTVAKKL